MDQNELLRVDFEDLSFSELAVIFAMTDTPVRKTRLQKTTLLFDEVFGVGDSPSDHSAYFFGGYSDNIDESAVSLTSAGILDETEEGYQLSTYGKQLREYATERILNGGDPEEKEIVDGMPKIVESISEIPDRYVVGLTYQYYEETAVKSTIRESVVKLNRSARYDGRRLDEISKEEFESKLRNGMKLHLDR